MVTENHTIYQNSKYTFLEHKEVEIVEPVQMKIYQIKLIEKTLAGYILTMSQCSREVSSERTTVLHIRFCSLSNNSNLQLGAPV